MVQFKSIGIFSCGEMGLGIAKLLIAHDYAVSTYAADRSANTQDNAREAGVHLHDNFDDFVSNIDVVLSIVPPRDAYLTAQRFADTVSPKQRDKPLYYLDLNATSTKTAARTAELFKASPDILLIDGGIIGGIPHPITETSNGSNDTHHNGTPTWHCPALIVSGPVQLSDSDLARTLRIDHVGPDIGAATGVKMCFAATTKGFVSLAIQSYTTAHQLGCLDTLRAYLAKYQPSTHALAEKGLVTMPPKAYRWVGEMKEIGDTVSVDGGFSSNL